MTIAVEKKISLGSRFRMFEERFTSHTYIVPQQVSRHFMNAHAFVAKEEDRFVRLNFSGGSRGTVGFLMSRAKALELAETLLEVASANTKKATA